MFEENQWEFLSPFSDEGFTIYCQDEVTRIKEGQLVEISKNKIVLKRKMNNKLVIHNEYGPAVVYKNGRTEWYLNGKLHRDEEDKPAVVSKNIQIWYKNGKRHRENAPALIKKDFHVWYKKGLKHRDDLRPAVEYKNGDFENWVDGEITCKQNSEDFFQYEKGKVKSLRNTKAGVYSEFSPKGEVIYLSDKSGSYWFQDGKLHGEHGPAVIDANKSMWYRFGFVHRNNDLPAVVYSNGTKKWYNYGKLHRANGPAIKRPNGDNEWYEHGKLIKCSSYWRTFCRLMDKLFSIPWNWE
jgi:hypothetical protein